MGLVKVVVPVVVVAEAVVVEAAVVVVVVVVVVVMWLLVLVLAVVVVATAAEDRLRSPLTRTTTESGRLGAAKALTIMVMVVVSVQGAVVVVVVAEVGAVVVVAMSNAVLCVAVAVAAPGEVHVDHATVGLGRQARLPHSNGGKSGEAFVRRALLKLKRSGSKRCRKEERGVFCFCFWSLRFFLQLIL